MPPLQGREYYETIGAADEGNEQLRREYDVASRIIGIMSRAEHQQPPRNKRFWDLLRQQPAVISPIVHYDAADLPEGTVMAAWLTKEPRVSDDGPEYHLYTQTVMRIAGGAYEIGVPEVRASAGDMLSEAPLVSHDVNLSSLSSGNRQRVVDDIASTVDLISAAVYTPEGRADAS